MGLADIPHLLAVLNTLSIILLSLGFYFIRSGQKDKHKACMITAVVVSAIFLGFYLVYHVYVHYYVGHLTFGGEGFVRTVYFTLLFIHILMAAINLPMIIITVLRAWRGAFDRHKAIARWTLPVWMFVAASGVVIYWMAFQMYPSVAGA